MPPDKTPRGKNATGQSATWKKKTTGQNVTYRKHDTGPHAAQGRSVSCPQTHGNFFQA